LIFVLLITDSLSVLLAFITSYFLRNKGVFRVFLDVAQPIHVYLQALPFAILTLLIVFAFHNLYDSRQRRAQISQTYSVFKGVTLWIILIMAGSYLYKFDYSRIIVILFYFFALIFVILGRLLVNKAYSYSFPKINIAVLGYGRSAKELFKRLKEYKSVGYNFIGFITQKKVEEKSVLGNLSDLRKIIKTYRIDEIYIADSTLSREKVLNLVAGCFDVPCKFRITSNIFDLITGTVDITNIENIPSLDINKVYFSRWQIFYKRFFDILFSGFALIAASPLFAAIILAIKLDSLGQAVLLQERVGRDSKLFNMYKFRTMYKESSLYKNSPRKRNDKRVTRVGKFLRRTSLDELPQLINVLKG
ncbi:MAG: sugar transferase, partial [Nanoarchaeota archaeon]